MFPELGLYLAQAVSPASTSQHPEILVVEDDDDNRMVMALALELFGVTPLLARDGATGLALALSALPVLILMDIGLPDMSGIEVMQHLKQNPDVCQIPVIAVTAMALAHERDQILAAGFASYLSKPYLMEDLYEGIKQQILSLYPSHHIL